MCFKEKLTGVVVSPDIYHDSESVLKSFGLDIVYSFMNCVVSLPLVYHSDMQLVRLSEDVYVSSPECYDYYNDRLKKYNKKIICGNTYLSCNYPGDIAYNIIINNNLAIHNFKFTDSVLKEKIIHKKCINVSQGYTACTVCSLNEKAFITSDKGVYNTLLNNLCDVLLIDDSQILLPGYDHGFIGGASVMLSEDILAVNGKIEGHIDYDNIKAFCANYKIDVMSLSCNQIMDIGSFVKI